MTETLVHTHKDTKNDKKKGERLILEVNVSFQDNHHLNCLLMYTVSTIQPTVKKTGKNKIGSAILLKQNVTNQFYI